MPIFGCTSKIGLDFSVYDGNIQNMLDWSRIHGFLWDYGNSRKSYEKHNVSHSEAEEVFFNQPLLVVGDARHSITEQRFHALGRTNGERTLHITFTLRERGQLIRIISARPMHRKERKIYEQSTQKDPNL